MHLRDEPIALTFILDQVTTTGGLVRWAACAAPGFWRTGHRVFGELSTLLWTAARSQRVGPNSAARRVLPVPDVWAGPLHINTRTPAKRLPNGTICALCKWLHPPFL